jgi:hypothetical protein
LFQIPSIRDGSSPSKKEDISRTTAATARLGSAPVPVISPHPVIPSSVSTCTKTYCRSSGTVTIHGATRLIFIGRSLLSCSGSCP